MHACPKSVSYFIDIEHQPPAVLRATKTDSGLKPAPKIRGKLLNMLSPQFGQAQP